MTPRLILPFALVLTLIAFAANSLLTRAALGPSLIGGEAYTLLRLVSGTVFLLILARPNPAELRPRGVAGWGGAVTLLVYMLTFTFAYTQLATGLGALVLFGVVQITLVLKGVRDGEAFGLVQGAALTMALAGLFILVGGDQGLSGSLWAAGLMALAGLAWGLHTAFGQGVKQPLTAAARNFLVASLAAIVLAGPGAVSSPIETTTQGVLLAVGSGVMASGLGYALWYWVLPRITALSAGISQLTVPLIAALAGLVFLDEPLTWRFAIAAVLILGGVALVFVSRAKTRAPQ